MLLQYHRYRAVCLSCFAVACCALALGFAGCKGKHKTINELAFEARKRKIVDDFPKIPHDEILQLSAGSRLYPELQSKYKNDLISLKTETDYDCTKLIVVIMSPEVGKNSTLPNTYGIPYIIKTCDNLGLDCYDLSEQIATKDMADISIFPDEGAWSKSGAAFVAQMLGNIIEEKYNDQRSSKDPSGKPKPPTFGDLPPNQDEVFDEEKPTQYRVKANAQGLRMSYNLTFPKTKQRILLLGDSRVFNPYMDNQFTIGYLLQQRFPNKEIVNAGIPYYTIDDFESLYREKARAMEADLIIVCTDGGDILDNYFSQRNKYSRAKKIYLPTTFEEDFYDELYRNK